MDTAFLIALVIDNDALHRRAVAWRHILHGPLLTSEFVLLEVADALCKLSRHSLAEDIFAGVRGGSVEIIPLSSAWLDRGWKLFCSRNDQDWGLTDCISFEIMNSRGISDALTHDRHFEQAGFRALLRSDPPAN